MFPLIWGFTDLDRKRNLIIVFVIRLLQAIFMTNTMVHPDEYWQSTMPAYKSVYGGDTWLPWEWSDRYRLRNTIYPIYLSLPMHLCKALGIDNNLVVRVVPYLAHLPVVILTDLFLWKISKRLIGHDAARLCFIFHFFNRFETMHIIRTLTNSLEQMFTVVAFWYYLDQKNKFCFNTIILTALISIAFMMRNTSPVGWIPLLAIKVFREGSLVPFIISGLFVALPILFFCVWVDTVTYGADKWVLTGYNFLEMNILHGLSKTFGEDPFTWYINTQMPFNLTLFTPFTYIALVWTHPTT
jgi:phosphatidylinositol glycan class B